MNILLISRMVAKSGVGNHMKKLSTQLYAQGHYSRVIIGNNALFLMS